MSDMVSRFSNYLNEIKYPKENESWDISGVLKNSSNEILNFDVKPMQKMFNNIFEKPNKLSNDADKIVFESKSKWVIIDKKELNNFILKNKIKRVHIDSLINNLEWNKFIDKKV
tara:strand:+ start:1204 stop:1545 length:342 start_codon:yes stop_codon:yes gene_type:complete